VWQEYAKAIAFDELRAPVVTMAFPGPSVHAKTARGALARYCATAGVRSPAQLRDFCGGETSGEWRFVAGESSEATLVFKRSVAAAAPAKAAAGGAKRGTKRRASEGDD
jgi:cytoplasmic iron level regulating protein YaaA (DUF328/UPF0246 family)